MLKSAANSKTVGRLVVAVLNKLMNSSVRGTQAGEEGGNARNDDETEIGRPRIRLLELGHRLVNVIESLVRVLFEVGQRRSVRFWGRYEGGEEA